jgi:hypothetical protein
MDEPAATSLPDYCRIEQVVIDSLMPFYLNEGYTFRQLWPLVSLALATAVGLALLFGLRAVRRWPPRIRLRLDRNHLMVATAFAGLGCVIGYMTTLSREPAVDAVLPAILSLVGAIAIFLIGGAKDEHGPAADAVPAAGEHFPWPAPEVRKREVVTIGMLALSMTLMVSAVWGAYQREASTAHPTSLDVRLHQARVEARVQQCRLQIEAHLDGTRLRLLKAQLEAQFFEDKFAREAEVEFLKQLWLERAAAARQQAAAVEMQK